MNLVCPSCGFRIFNRRYSKCERCGQGLPQALLLSPAAVARLDAEAEASRRAQQARLADARSPSPSPGIDYSLADFAIGAIQDLADGSC